MLLGGLWHGAAWTFIAWGAYQGFWLVVERLAGKRALYGWAPRPAQMALTFVLAMLGWVFFRADGISAAFGYFGSLAGTSGPGAAALAVRPIHWVAGAAAVVLVWGLPTTQALVHRAAGRLGAGAAGGLPAGAVAPALRGPRALPLLPVLSATPWTEARHRTA